MQTLIINYLQFMKICILTNLTHSAQSKTNSNSVFINNSRNAGEHDGVRADRLHLCP